MKIFFGLMAILLLSLSFFPCGDKQDCIKDTTSVVAEVNQDSNHEHGTEFCSPFCSCACCSVIFYTEGSIKNLSRNLGLFKVKYPAASSSFHNNVFYSIWHPPQLIA